MRLLIALIFPPLVFFTINRPFQGLMCAILWLTIIGWPIAAIWAVYSLSQYRNEELARDLHYSRSDRYRY
ncbi:YqaE/Pmp3 family membrane protein [Temperatibacter marinus]|uniref:YqaE/Pmp3 family membrane protein n=1 Tax=Temperatibacter marinus TaxID=1456591 RepID=A0AA52H9N4_9PROT|nr:YqaE/Pmp3 family membrane protein [Temperatibacter marinus]WND03099.1 YqaE/Pmp3 family membrane protein [Temperatibacter marinus]